MSRPATVAESILDGNGYVYKRPDSEVWQCRFKVGKTWVIKSTGEKDRKAAIEKAQELFFEAKFRQRDGLPISTGKTFAVIAKVIADELKPKATPNSSAFNHWSRITNHLIPYFGAKRINNISTDDIRQFHAKLVKDAGKELSTNTIKNYNTTLNLVFARAVDTKAMTKAEVPDMPVRGEKKTQRPAFTEEEFKELCKHMLVWVDSDELNAFHRNRRRLLQVLVYFVAKTGVRPGTESESISWSGIKPFVRDGQEYVDIRVEGKVGPRNFVADITVLQLLNTLKTSATYEIKPTDRVFVLPDGSDFSKSGELFKELLVSAGLLNDPATDQERTLYSLRHYYITEALYRDVSPAVIAKQCGTSIAMIDKNYSKVSPRLAAKQIVPKP